MKKVLLSVVCMLAVCGAFAQNQAIDVIASKYAGTEGFTVVNLEGEMIGGLVSMMGEVEITGDITLDDGKTYSAADLLEDISSVTAIIPREKADEIFKREIEHAVKAVNYKTLVSLSEEGGRVKVLETDLKKGKFKGQKEIVVWADGEGSFVFVRLVGKIDAGLVAQILPRILD